MTRFNGSVAVVTGSSRGIGREIALRLWSEGATVCLVGRERSSLEAAIPFRACNHERVRCYVLDITQDQEVRKFGEKLEEDCGRVDILVHSAGTFAYGEWQFLSIEALDILYRTNLRAPILLTQVLLPLLRTSMGQIVLINSSIVKSARAKVGAYSLTKHGLGAFADSLREEVNSEGIRVISVYPGRTATAMQQLACRHEGSLYRPEQLLRPEDVAVVVVNALEPGCKGQVTDIHVRPT